MSDKVFKEGSEFDVATRILQSNAMINENDQNSSEDLNEDIDYSRKISNVKSQMRKDSRRKRNPQKYVEDEMMELEDALYNFQSSIIGAMNNVDSRMRIDLRHIDKKIDEIVELTNNWTV